jgi:xanthine dehydrogenase accessory factor
MAREVYNSRGKRRSEPPPFARGLPSDITITMLELYREVVKLIEAGERGAIATVIGATGSTPGKESAKMLVRADGSTMGTIGGGCTEADVWALARQVIDSDQPIRKSFRLTPQAAAEEGLACGGIVEIFIEPVGSPVVYIFGAGHIARSVVHLAAHVGLNTVVVDDREQFVNRRFFPEATGLVVADLSSCMEKLKITPTSYLVIVTRGHRYDQVVLSQAIRTRASYIGLIGSRVKVARIFHTLMAEGATPEQLAAVRAPIGLDLGCRTPEEIAVSIVAQLIAQRRKAYVKGKDPSRLPLPRPIAAAEADAPQEGTPAACAE